MEESWEDLLRRVYYAGYDDRQRERDYDPMDHKIVDTASIRAEKMEQRIRELEEGLRPFTQEGFQAALGGNVEGDDSPVYGREGSILTLGDFRRAKKLLAPQL